MQQRPWRKVRKLIVPLVLGATVVAGVSAVATSTTACGDKPRVDAAVDTPIV